MNLRSFPTIPGFDATSAHKSLGRCHPCLSPAEGLQGKDKVSTPGNSSSLLQEPSVALDSSGRNGKSPINLPMWRCHRCRGELSLQGGDGSGWVMPRVGESMEQGPAVPWECSHQSCSAKGAVWEPRTGNCPLARGGASLGFSPRHSSVGSTRKNGGNDTRLEPNRGGWGRRWEGVWGLNHAEMP